jgi:hypothetical protein
MNAILRTGSIIYLKCSSLAHRKLVYRHLIRRIQWDWAQIQIDLPQTLPVGRELNLKLLNSGRGVMRRPGHSELAVGDWDEMSTYFIIQAENAPIFSVLVAESLYVTL